MDREKVIKGLECCAEDKCEACPYAELCYSDEIPLCSPMAKDALELLELLRVQEARVMTLDEVKNHNNQDGCVWFEQPTYNAVAAFVRKEEFEIEVISPYILGDPINHGYWMDSNYGKTWRCWTSRPTEDQREAVKWE